MNENITNVQVNEADQIVGEVANGTSNGGKFVLGSIIAGAAVGTGVLIYKGVKKLKDKISAKKAAKAEANEEIEVEVECED